MIRPHEMNFSHRQGGGLETRMRGSGFDGNSFMSNTGLAESNIGHVPAGGLHANPSRISNDGGGYARGGYGGFI